MHSLHTWSQGLAKRGYFVLASYNGGPDGVIPINGTLGIFGTNPITYGFPTNEGTVVVDMATSEIPYFEIKNAIDKSLELKPNTAVDKEGQVTTDPNKAFDHGISNLLPMGANYKGYAINYLFEIMTGALIGAKLSNKQDPSYVNEDHGGFLIVIDINAFSSVETFKSEVSELNTIVRKQKPVAGVDKVIIPGDNNLQRLKDVIDSGTVEVDKTVITKLKSLAT
jgi:LDH2 family malate/lactate/ureidoglycolate dehydrogenase